MLKPEVGGLARASNNWLQLNTSDWLLSVIRVGFRLLWDERKAPLSSHPPVWRPLSSQEAQEALEAEVVELVRKRAVELVLRQSSPGFYGRLFVVPKTKGGWRPVLDLSSLNLFLKRVKFRMETPDSVRLAIKPGDWAASIDLSDAYFHILIHQRDRKFLRFVWKGSVYQFRALPFGLSLAPWIFTMVVREICALVRGMGIFMRAYLDDWLVHSQKQETCLQNTSIVLQRAQQLGFYVNIEKSDLVPSQDFIYLGMKFDTVAYVVKPAPARIEKLLATLSRLLNKETVSAREIAGLLGSMESMASLIPLGRVYKRPLQREFKARWDQTTQLWDQEIPVGPWLRSTVLPWRDPLWLQEGVPIVMPPPDRDLFTDASLLGWGAHMGEHIAHGVWTESQMGSHINLLELEAVALALESFQPLLLNLHVRVVTDNRTVSAYINRQGGTISKNLSVRTEQMLIWARESGISISARYISGSLNILADQLSRPHTVIQTEWTLAHKVLEPVWDLWGKPLIDLFATRFNHRLPIYVSPVPDPHALAVDALELSWVGLDAYAFPPLPLIQRVLRKAEEDGPRLILILPHWPAQAWFPDLLRQTHCPPLPLDVQDRGLLQPRSGIPHGNPRVLDLHAWFLCGVGCAH